MITVLGAGSWGTALAAVLANNGHNVCIWGRNKLILDELINQNTNNVYLSNIKILFDDLKNIQVTDSLDESINNSTKYILIALPSNIFTKIIQDLKNIFFKKNLKNIIIIGSSKGLDLGPENIEHNQEPKWLNQIAADILGNNYPYCLLSGPSFANEVALKQPTAVVMACTNIDIAKKSAEIFHNNWFRVYCNEDIIGVQLGGALKNIMAFAVGCSQGVGFGSNARAALITRGLNEMLNLGSKLNAKFTTIIGLSGLGDLVLSATDQQSRNQRLGFYLGQGMDKTQALQKIGQHVESLKTTKLIYNLAKSYALDLPITEQVYNILYNNMSVNDAVANLVSRPPKNE